MSSELMESFLHDVPAWAIARIDFDRNLPFYVLVLDQEEYLSRHAMNDSPFSPIAGKAKRLVVCLNVSGKRFIDRRNFMSHPVIWLPGETIVSWGSRVVSRDIVVEGLEAMLGTTPTIKLGDVAFGKRFLFNDKLCMRINLLGCEISYVELESGKVHTLSSDTPVIPVGDNDEP